MRWVQSKRRGQLGISFIELIIGAIIASIVFMAIYQIMRTNIQSGKRIVQAGVVDDALTRFNILMTQDITRAGSDPSGLALLSYQTSDGCSSKIYFKYGINPDPGDPSTPCTDAAGSIQILSYLAYDDDNDGTIDVEESLDLSGGIPDLRPDGDDNVVYAFIDTDSDGSDDTIVRRNYGNVDTTGDDTEEIVLQNVISFNIKYYGYVTGVYGGEVTDPTRYDDIREVEVNIVTHAESKESGYVNPAFAGTQWEAYRTEESTFRVSLLVRKE